MKTPKQIITEITESGEGHECACCCDRCKNGRETFLLPSDIIAIQRDALESAAQIAESYDNGMHHGNDTFTKQNIASEIRAAAMPNGKAEASRSNDVNNPKP